VVGWGVVLVWLVVVVENEEEARNEEERTFFRRTVDGQITVNYFVTQSIPPLSFRRTKSALMNIALFIIKLLKTNVVTRTV